MIDSIQIHLFYPLLFIAIIVLIVTIGIVIVKTKDNGLFNNIFNRHSEEHEDTTSKMAQMHDNVIKVDFTDSHEKELDYLEKGLAKLEKEVKELSQKLDILLERIINLETK